MQVFKFLILIQNILCILKRTCVKRTSSGLNGYVFKLSAPHEVPPTFPWGKSPIRDPECIFQNLRMTSLRNISFP